MNDTHAVKLVEGIEELRDDALHNVGLQSLVGRRISEVAQTGSKSIHDQAHMRSTVAPEEFKVVQENRQSIHLLFRDESHEVTFAGEAFQFMLRGRCCQDFESAILYIPSL